MRVALGVALVVGAAGLARGEDVAGRFAPTASLQIPRDGARAITVGNDVLVIGGENDLEGPLRSAPEWEEGYGEATAVAEIWQPTQKSP